MELLWGALPPDLESSLVRALDRPAREALELGRARPARSLALGAAGLALWSGSSLLANGLLGRWTGFDALGGALESLAIAVPGLLIFSMYLRVAVPPRALLAAQAVGLWTAGVVGACLVPLLAFMALATHGAPEALHLRGVLIPAAGLAVAMAVPLRILVALDRSSRARWMGRLFVATVAVSFLFQLQLSFPYMLDVSGEGLSADLSSSVVSPYAGTVRRWDARHGR